MTGKAYNSNNSNSERIFPFTQEMPFIGGKTLLFAFVLLAVFVGTKTAGSVLVEGEATTAHRGEYKINVDSEASVADREVETDSEMKFGEVNDGRQKRSES